MRQLGRMRLELESSSIKANNMPIFESDGAGNKAPNTVLCSGRYLLRPNAENVQSGAAARNWCVRAIKWFVETTSLAAALRHGDQQLPHAFLVGADSKLSHRAD